MPLRPQHVFLGYTRAAPMAEEASPWEMAALAQAQESGAAWPLRAPECQSCSVRLSVGQNLCPAGWTLEGAFLEEGQERVACLTYQEQWKGKTQAERCGLPVHLPSAP